MNFVTPSRRDDLISLVYLMISILDYGNLPGLPVQTYSSWKKGYKTTLKAKQKMTPEILCGSKSIYFKQFID